MLFWWFFSPLACLNALFPSDFCLVPKLLNHPELLDVILPLADPGCEPCTAPAFLLQQNDGDTPESVEGYPGSDSIVILLNPLVLAPLIPRDSAWLSSGLPCKVRSTSSCRVHTTQVLR